jgi:hypothetical protein
MGEGKYHRYGDLKLDFGQLPVAQKTARLAPKPTPASTSIGSSFWGIKWLRYEADKLFLSSTSTLFHTSYICTTFLFMLLPFLSNL